MTYTRTRYIAAFLAISVGNGSNIIGSAAMMNRANIGPLAVPFEEATPDALLVTIFVMEAGAL